MEIKVFAEGVQGQEEGGAPFREIEGGTEDGGDCLLGTLKLSLGDSRRQLPANAKNLVFGGHSPATVSLGQALSRASLALKDTHKFTYKCHFVDGNGFC